MRPTIPCLAMILAACSSPEPPPAEPSAPASTDAELDAARRSLERATAFEDDAIGYAGIPSEGAEAFAVIWNHPAAADHFAALTESATPAGRLYGLLGLAHADRGRYPGALGAIGGLPGDCEFMRGCTRASLPIARLARDIDGGAWDGIVEFAQARPRRR